MMICHKIRQKQVKDDLSQKEKKQANDDLSQKTREKQANDDLSKKRNIARIANAVQCHN